MMTSAKCLLISKGSNAIGAITWAIAEHFSLATLYQDFRYYPNAGLLSEIKGWWHQYRRLSKDYELLPEIGESIIYMAMIRFMLKRLAQSPAIA